MRKSTAFFVICLVAGVVILASCSALPATQGDLEEATTNLQQGMDTAADGLAQGSLFKTISGSILALIGAIGVGAKTLKRFDAKPFQNDAGQTVTENDIVNVVRASQGKSA